MKSKINSLYRFNINKRIFQGDIFTDMNMISYEVEENKKENKIEVNYEKIIFPYLIVVSQDCDLELDFNKRELIENNSLDNKESEKQSYDKFLDSILVCPAFPSEDLKEGNHLKDMGRIIGNIPTKRWKTVKNNDNPRYHYLDKGKIKDNDGNEVMIDSLAIDFKKYYTIPRNYLYYYKKDKYIASLNELIREDLSNRFAYFLSRIGLPEFNEE
ncbi:MAG: hypothetical protein LBT66_07555 [Methanobrevibacter sp.]|jgi:hypothetical protein|nr:hypothetical protein [Candidatus Methanovirga meridionalis]